MVGHSKQSRSSRKVLMPEINCHHCNKLFCKKPSQIGLYKLNFCSKPCYLDYNSKKSSLTEEKCAGCNALIFRTNSQRKKSLSGLFFCTKACGNKFKIASKLKKWRVLSPKNHRSRKEEIFKAANYTCQKCGYNKDKRMLDLHHHDGNHSNNNWSNLRCVCVWWHTKHHRSVEQIDLPVIIGA